MDTLFNATVEYQGVSGESLNTIRNVVQRYDGLGGYSFTRSNVTITTDLSWFKQNAGFDPNQLGYNAVFSQNISGQHTIWIREDSVSEAIVLHELMHGTHRGLGPNALHTPEFYLQHGEISDELGLTRHAWHSPSRGITFSPSGDFNGGNQFSAAVAKYGLSDEQLQRLIELDGDIGVVVLRTHLERFYDSAEVTALSSKYEEFTGKILPESCFGGEAPIDMWPLDPDLKPGPDGIYDQDEVRAKVWKKPIEQIRVGDIVVSFDDDGNLVPGPVTRTFQNNAKILLNFHGTRVTPGHVYYRSDSKKSYKYETLIDILRDDGVIKHQDGTLIRAATNAPVDSPRDGFVRAVTGKRKADGTVVQNDAGRIRLGTRFLVGTGKERRSFAVADLIEYGGGVVGDDELIRVGDGAPMPFHWEFGDTLPKPEDFVLACSGTTLEDIYKAAEWESQGPRLPAPMVLDRGPVQPLKGAALSAMPRNEPLDVVHSPTASAKPQRTPNRKQRGAIDAKQNKAANSRKCS